MAKINVIPIVETLAADLLTPLAVYLKLAESGDSFLLESVQGGETVARYSFIGCDPQFSIHGGQNGVTYVFNDGRRRFTAQPMFEVLREHFEKYAITQVDGLPSFAGGAIGAMDFSCSAWFEPKLRECIAPSDDESAFMFCRSIIAFDHARQIIKIVSLVFEDEIAPDKTLQQLCDEAADRNRAIRFRLENDSIRLPRREQFSASSSVSNFTRSEFENAVRTAKECIAAGDAYQIVLSQCFTRPTMASHISIYRAIRSLNPSPYMFLIKLGQKYLIGASPEMLVRCTGSIAEYRPIAGTRPRGSTPEEDTLFAQEMAADAKELAEHMMLVDLGRNDLGRVAAFGSVHVDSLMKIEKYSHVQHLVSCLSAKLSDGKDRFDALASCFPAGTVSGAPKVSAIQIIDRLEPSPRGIYSGAVGYFDYAGNMDMCIAIRTMSLQGGIAKIQAGAGIVADSDPSAEYRETINKAAGLLRAIDIAERGDL